MDKTSVLFASVIHSASQNMYYVGYVDCTDNNWHLGYSAMTAETCNEYIRNHFVFVAVRAWPNDTFGDKTIKRILDDVTD